MMKKNKLNQMIMILGIVITMGSILNASSVDIFFSYSNYDYAPYNISFGGGYYDDFNDILAPYGHWVMINMIGRVWVPHVHISWRPYFYGYWVYTIYGPTWVSYEPWGWVTHHYGRWFYYQPYGWCWMPTYIWGPAWVEWRISGGFIAWMPMPPHHFFYKKHHNLYNNYRSNAYYYKSYADNDYYFSGYVVVKAENFFERNISKYRIKDFDPNLEFKAIPKAPDKQFLEKYSNFKVKQVNLRRDNIFIAGKKTEYYTPEGQLESIIDGNKNLKNIVIPFRKSDLDNSGKKAIVKNDRFYFESMGKNSSDENLYPRKKPSDYNEYRNEMREEKFPPKPVYKYENDMAVQGKDVYLQHYRENYNGEPENLLNRKDGMKETHNNFKKENKNIILKEKRTVENYRRKK